MSPRTGRLAGAAVVGLVGLLAGIVSLSPRLSITGQRGDWRGASEGLRRSGTGEGLVASNAALVHFHELGPEPAEVRLTVSRRSPAADVQLAARLDEQPLFEIAVPASPTTFVVRVPPGSGGVDLVLLARSSHPSQRLYRIHEIRLQKAPTRAGRLRQGVPAVMGLAVFLVLCRVGLKTWIALVWSLLLVGVIAAVVVTLADPPSLLRFRPSTRDGLQIAALVTLWTLSVASLRSGWTAIAALLGTVVILYLPTLRFGFVSDDILWVRPWSVSELLSTLVGSQDPLGQSNTHYRPVASWSHALDYWIWGLRAWGTHLTNLVLHGANGVVAWMLLRRLGLPLSGSLAGALCWVAHPMSASAVSWASQRTDEWVTLFSLGCLAALLSPEFGRRHALLTLALAVLALGSKETAVTLPAAAAVAVRLGLGPDAWTRRRRTVGLLFLLVAAYVGFWIALFPEKFLSRTRDDAGWMGFEPDRIGDWLRLLPGLYAPILAPIDYERWYFTPLRELPLAYLLVPLAFGLAVFTWVRRCRSCGPARKVILLALVWPLIVIWPLLGLKGLDVYRVGLLLCFAFGLFVASAVTHLGAHHGRLAVGALLAAIGLWLTPLSARAAAAFAPDGFKATRLTGATLQNREWLEAITPEMRRAFLEQVERSDHPARLLGVRAPSEAETATSQEP